MLVQRGGRRLLPRARHLAHHLERVVELELPIVGPVAHLRAEQPVHLVARAAVALAQLERLAARGDQDHLRVRVVEQVRVVDGEPAVAAEARAQLGGVLGPRVRVG